MRRIPKSGIIFGLFVVGLIFLNLLFQVPQGEGYNPSDDGVILAQAYRILYGEVPHVDFISIRPVGSAIFHSLSFVLPFPFEVTARWITLLEFLISSLLWSWLLFSGLPKRFRKLSFLVLLASLIYVLNQNFYNLFPWTTIDAIFFFSLAYFTYLNWRGADLTKWQNGFRIFVIFFFAGFAALCRQTFALPALVLGLIIIGESFKQKRYADLILGGLTGMWPYYLYLIVLLRKGAFGSFVEQLTGRTELWQTGFQTFSDQFWTSPLLILFIILIVAFLLFQIAWERLDSSLLQNLRSWLTLVLLTIFLTVIILIFVDPDNLFFYSFQLFWFYVLLLFCQPMFRQKAMRSHGIHIMILLLAWTSAISLGDNSPVFVTGLLSGGILLLLILQLTESRSFNILAKRSMVYTSLFLSACLIAVGIFAQKRNNYRDLPANDLNFRMSSFMPNMGGIRTNSRTYSYMLEISEIYNSLSTPEDRFVVLPNATLIYPILETRNPMPLDWMQGPEFVGQDSVLGDRLKNMEKGSGIYLLFDKYNTKLFADSLVLMSYSKENYPYYEYLISHSSPVETIRSEWFDVRFWQ